MALTFDDGPDPIWTPRVLAVLARTRAAATFFVDGRRATIYPELVEAAIEAGHEIGLHCFDHVRHSELGEQAVSTDFRNGLDALGTIGIRPSAYRAPWGDVTEATRRAASAHGLSTWGWSHDTHDWRGDSCAEMLSKIDLDGDPKGGAVVLMHDGIGPGARRSGCEQTVRLVGALIERMIEDGLRPVTLSNAAQEGMP